MKVFYILLLSLFSLNAFAQVGNTNSSHQPIQQPVDKATEIEANLKQAKYMLKNGDYGGAKKKLDRVLDLDEHNTEAKKLQVQCQSKIDEQLKIEKDSFKKACLNGSIEALQSFISTYPNSQLRVEAENRIKDYHLWMKAKQENTKNSYLNYLTQSQIKSYRTEAEQIISQFDAADEWETIKDTKSISNLENFIQKYGSTQYAPLARYQINILKGEHYYSLGNHSQALSFLSAADNYSRLVGIPATHLQELTEEKEFNDIIISTSVEKVKNYLNELSPNSHFYTPASNHLALLLATKLDLSSSDYMMNEALSYAKDNNTRATVKSYIQRAKEKRSKLRRARLKYAHKIWWEDNFKIGIDADIETNTDPEAGSDLFYSAGLIARFGSFEHLFNLVFGVKYRWCSVLPDYQDYYDNGKDDYQLYGGALCIPLSLRFNVAFVSTRSRLYIGVGGEYGISMFEKREKKGSFEKNYFSLYPQVGLTSPYFDISCYWKTYFGGPFVKMVSENYDYYKCKSLIGIQMSFFF